MRFLSSYDCIIHLFYANSRIEYIVRTSSHTIKYIFRTRAHTAVSNVAITQTEIVQNTASIPTGGISGRLESEKSSNPTGRPAYEFQPTFQMHAQRVCSITCIQALRAQNTAFIQALRAQNTDFIQALRAYYRTFIQALRAEYTAYIQLRKQ